MTNKHEKREGGNTKRTEKKKREAESEEKRIEEVEIVSV